MFPTTTEAIPIHFKAGHWPPSDPEFVKLDNSYVVEESKSHPSHWPPTVVFRKRDA